MIHRTVLERRLPLAWIVAWRYVRGERSQVLSSTALAALFATTLGVTAMVIALSLMTGYTDDLRQKLIGLARAVAGVGQRQQRERMHFHDLAQLGQLVQGWAFQVALQ